MKTKLEWTPAFPQIYQDENQNFYSGMSMRDWFATFAPTKPSSFDRLEGEYRKAVVKAPTVEEPGRVTWSDVWYENETLLEWETRWRYAYADAMIKARGAIQ